MTSPSFNMRLYEARQRHLLSKDMYNDMLEYIYDDIIDRLHGMKRDIHRLICINPGALSDDAIQQASGAKEIVRCNEAALQDVSSGSIDAVIGYVPLHYNTRPDMFLTHVRRILSPGGLMLTAFFGERSLHQLRLRIMEHETAASGGVAARVMPMIDIKTAGMLLQHAGFSICISDINGYTLEYATPYSAIKELRACGLGNILLPFAPLSKATAIALKQDENMLPLTVQTITLTAEKKNISS